MKPPKEPRIPPITKKDPEDEQQCSACGTGRELLLQVSLLARVILVGAHAAPGLPFYTGRCLRPILHAFMEGPPQSSAAAGHRPSAVLHLHAPTAAQLTVHMLWHGLPSRHRCRACAQLTYAALSCLCGGASKGACPPSPLLRRSTQCLHPALASFCPMATTMAPSQCPLPLQCPPHLSSMPITIGQWAAGPRIAFFKPSMHSRFRTLASQVLSPRDVLAVPVTMGCAAGSLLGVLQAQLVEDADGLCTQPFRSFTPCRSPWAVPQGFNWESSKHSWWRTLMGQVDAIKEDGFTGVWLPPCTQSLSEQVRLGWGKALPGGALVPAGARHCEAACWLYRRPLAVWQSACRAKARLLWGSLLTVEMPAYCEAACKQGSGCHAASFFW